MRKYKMNLFIYYLLKDKEEIAKNRYKHIEPLTNNRSIEHIINNNNYDNMAVRIDFIFEFINPHNNSSIIADEIYRHCIRESLKLK